MVRSLSFLCLLTYEHVLLSGNCPIVCFPMSVPIGGTAELPVAHVALVILLTSVDIIVSFELIARCECLFA
uniref:Putative secreted protein n=1 Tax=Anopheles marajoara TaxID=58244 RepID=A0A2M4CFE2_9DIPT